MRTQVRLNGEEVSIDLKMWSRKDRDQIDRKHGMPGSVYISQVIGVVARETRSPIAKDLLIHLIEKERKRQDDVASDYAIDAVCMVASRDGQKLTYDQVANLPDDEFEALNQQVMEFLLNKPNKMLLLKSGLANIIKDEKLFEQVAKFVDEVMLGRVEAKN